MQPYRVDALEKVNGISRASLWSFIQGVFKRAKAMKYLVHLQTFLLVARTGNITRAAKRLCITTGAVSLRLKALEEKVGTALLKRHSQGVWLTPQGEALYSRVERHMVAIEEALHEMSDDHRPFTISVMPWLASSWLMPRLHRFTQAHPEAVIRVETSSALADLKSGEVSAALRFGQGEWPDTYADHLFDEWVAPVAHPALIERLELKVDRPDQWPLLNDPDDWWPLWFSQHRQTHGSMAAARPSALTGVNLQDANTLAEAACTGWGVILGRSTQVHSLLEEKKLQLLSDRWIKAPRSHYLVRASEREVSPLFNAFQQWLHAELQTHGTPTH